MQQQQTTTMNGGGTKESFAVVRGVNTEMRQKPKGMVLVRESPSGSKHGGTKTVEKLNS